MERNGKSSLGGAHDCLNGYWRRVLPNIKIAELTVHAVCPTARYVPAKVRRFIEYVATDFAGEPPWDRHQMASRGGIRSVITQPQAVRRASQLGVACHMRG
jgi:hypothetical protein